MDTLQRAECPACHQQAGVRIIWGRPTEQDYARVEAGWDVTLGGCRKEPVDRECTSCGHRWAAKTAAQASSECLMDDGDHAPALPGHDLCPPCEARMDTIRQEGDR